MAPVAKNPTNSRGEVGARQTRAVGSLSDDPRLSPVAVNVMRPDFEARRRRLSDVDRPRRLVVEGHPAFAAVQRGFERFAHESLDLHLAIRADAADVGGGREPGGHVLGTAEIDVADVRAGLDSESCRRSLAKLRLMAPTFVVRSALPPCRSAQSILPTSSRRRHRRHAGDPDVSNLGCAAGLQMCFGTVMSKSTVSLLCPESEGLMALMTSLWPEGSALIALLPAGPALLPRSWL